MQSNHTHFKRNQLTCAVCTPFTSTFKPSAKVLVVLRMRLQSIWALPSQSLYWELPPLGPSAHVGWRAVRRPVLQRPGMGRERLVATPPEIS